MRSLRFAALAAAVVLLAAVSCGARPPSDQARRARSALADLRDVAHGDIWAPELYTAASEAVTAADREVVLQGSRMRWSRDYDRAAELYTRALEDIDLARRAAQEGLDRAEKAARHAVDEAASSIVRARSAMMVAPVPRSGRETFARIDAELDRAERRMDELHRLLAASEFTKAQTAAAEVQTQVNNLIRTMGRAAAR